MTFLLLNAPLGLPLSAADAQQIQWQDVLDEIKGEYVSRFVEVLSARMLAARETGDKKAEALFALLSVVASFRLRLDQKHQPFSRFSEIANFRTPGFEDLSDDNHSVLKALAPAISNPWMRARLCDVVSTRIKSEIELTREAIKAYFSAAAEFSTDRWPESADCIERALQIAYRLGTRSAEFSETIAKIVDLIHARRSDPTRFPLTLMRLLLECKQGDAAVMASICDQLRVLDRTDLSRWELPRRCLEVKAEWLERAGDKTTAAAALEEAAASFVDEAESVWATKNPNLSANALWTLKRAIDAYRAVGKKDRADDLHARYLEWQAASVAHGVFRLESDPVDISDFVRESIRRVKGRRVEDAVLALATICGPLREAGLRETAESISRESPLLSIIPPMLTGQDGKLLAVGRPLAQQDPKAREEVIREAMHRLSPGYRSDRVLAVIGPAHQQIVSEHQVRLDHLASFVVNNPFVPPDHIHTVIRGLYFGFIGDWDVATAMLAPQIEASIRHILRSAGCVVSTLATDAEHTQEEFDLGRIFGDTRLREKLAEILSADLVFDLEGLLIDRWGGNVRNRNSHGLMTDAEYFSENSVYLWWLTLHMLCRPVVASLLSRGQPDHDR